MLSPQAYEARHLPGAINLPLSKLARQAAEWLRRDRPVIPYYTLPPEPPPILVAAGGPETAARAGRIGDGLVGTSPQPELQWPISGMSGPLYSELPLPAHFEPAAEMVREEEDLEGEVICVADPEEHLEGVRKLAEAGYDHVWVHQIGPEQDGFFRFYEREAIPKLDRLPTDKKAA